MKKIFHDHFPSGKWKKTLFVMKLSIALILCCAGTIAASPAFSQQKRSDVSYKKEPLGAVLDDLRNRYGYHIIYFDNIVPESNTVTFSKKGATIEEILDEILPGNNLAYSIKDQTIRISRAQTVRQQQVTEHTITGSVKDEAGNPVVGASVVVEGTTRGVSTDLEGMFSLTVPNQPLTLVFSYVGMDSQKVHVPQLSDGKPHGPVNVVLKQDQLDIEDVIITGIYTRSKESFTGSASTYTVEDLRNMGTSNILQGLKTLDPTFAILDDNQYGSDPNRMPNMEIRGKSSMLGMRDELESDPNQPLFILDGFESSVSAVMDLDLNRVESITVLKDAASTAIYGSKAANGVIVVETVKPVAGELRVNYTGSLNLSMPDLTSYNLMNAREKLEFDVLTNRFLGSTSQQGIELKQIYNNILDEINSGVDTYWLAEPLRVGVNQKHSLYVQGGEGSFLFGLGGSYNGNSGVMEKSVRRVTSGNIDLIYRRSKLQFSNKFSVNGTRMENPVVPFEEYAKASPYYKKTGPDGEPRKWLDDNDYYRAENPLWNAGLNSRDKGNNLAISDYFVAEYSPTSDWKLRARFGLTYQNNDTEVFYSRDDTRYEYTEEVRKGQFSTTNSRLDQYEGEFTATWARLFGRNRINLVAGGNIFNSKTLVQGYTVEGFPDGDFTYPSFSNGYPENSIPVYYEVINRSLNGYMNLGYSFADRYLMDFSLRSSGSSVFGTGKKYNTTWSVGLGWNLHRERFVAENLPWLDFLKLRASIGNPGNQSFDSAQSLLTYAFQYGSLNYFGLGAMLDQVGNPNLKWQTTTDKNIGIDITVLDKRLSVTADFFHKVTDPLLIRINMPESSGVDSYLTNAGEQIAKGFTASVSYYIFRNLEERFIWMVRGNIRTQKIRIDKVSDKLQSLTINGRGKNTTRYYDGSDPDDIWAVRSMGIDPSNGRELFLTPDGKFTYDFSYENEVVCGNIRPDAEGVVGTQVTWKGLTVSLNFRYQFGADIFNDALYQKVENITSTQRKYNQDKRALYERWKQPGDIVRFKDVLSAEYTPISSRFIQRENVFVLESLYLSYEFLDGWIRKAGLSNLRVYFSMRDVFRSSSIRSERGLSYPFARSLEAGMSFNF